MKRIELDEESAQRHNTNTEPEAVAPGFNVGWKTFELLAAPPLCVESEPLLRPVATASGSVFVDPPRQRNGLANPAVRPDHTQRTPQH